MMQFWNIMPNFYQTTTPMYSWASSMFNWSFPLFNYSYMPIFSWSMPSFNIRNTSSSNPFITTNSTSTSNPSTSSTSTSTTTASNTNTNHSFSNYYISTPSTSRRSSVFSTTSTASSKFDTFTSTIGTKTNLVRNNKSAKSIMQNAASLALSQVGVRETSKNDSIQIRKYKNNAVNSNPWCGSFVSWCYGRGQDRSNSSTFGYNTSSQSIKKDAIKNSCFHGHGYKPQVGDLAIWTKSGSSGHIGIVTAVNGNKVTITQGNCGNGVKSVTYDLRNIKYNGGHFSGFVDMETWLSKKS